VGETLAEGNISDCWWVFGYSSSLVKGDRQEVGRSNMVLVAKPTAAVDLTKGALGSHLWAVLK
jgi:hypothetical protein